MSDSDDQVTKKKHDDQSAGCSKIFDTCAQSLLYGTQSADSNQSTQTMKDVGDIMIETNNDQDSFHSGQIIRVRVGKNPAERNRLYRERHREEINQRRRENRQRKKKSQQIHRVSIIQNINEIEQITRTPSNNQRSSSYTKRQKRYYESHKEEINKRKRDRRLKQNISQTIPATAAERNRDYRERNRQKINERRRNSRLLQQNVQRVFHEVIKPDPDALEQDENNSGSDDTYRNSSTMFEEKLVFNDIVPILREMASYLQTMANKQEDTFESFGTYVATMLRNMPEQNSMELQLQIVNLLQNI
ncbi:unnamed protein product, partial [Brenthis ino]